MDSEATSLLPTRARGYTGPVYKVLSTKRMASILHVVSVGTPPPSGLVE